MRALQKSTGSGLASIQPLRNMENKSQEEIPIDGIVNVLKEKIVSD